MFKRRFKRSRGYRKNRRYVKKNKKTSFKRFVKKVAATALETKFVQYNLSSSLGTLPATWTELVMSNTASAPGKQYQILGYALKGTMSSGTSLVFSSDEYNRVRILIALWRGLTLTGTIAPLGNLADKPAIWEVIDKDNSKALGMMKKYYDKTILIKNTPIVHPNDTVDYDHSIKSVKISKWFKSPIVCNLEGGTANPPTSFADKFLVLSAISDSTFTPHPGFLDGYLRVYYRDN